MPLQGVRKSLYNHEWPSAPLEILRNSDASSVCEPAALPAGKNSKKEILNRT